MDLNRRLGSVDTSRFSMVPRADIPRSTFRTTHTHKTTFNASYLIPIEVNEVLPGDVHQVDVNIFARLATPVFPLMDNIRLETMFFFVPARLVWDNFKKMMGERRMPSDHINYIVPVTFSPVNGFTPHTIFDYFGLPTVGQIPGGQVQVNCLPLRAYNFIWNEWFRDQNLQNPHTFNTHDGPDTYTDFVLKRRNKRHDYFTSALPWPLKGGVEIGLPLTGTAVVKGIAYANTGTPTAGAPGTGYQEGTGGNATGWTAYYTGAAIGTNIAFGADSTAPGANPQIYADLNTVAGATINALRLAFQTQRLLERDARGGTRYTELLLSHFGVEPEDSRLQRPEYIGGGRTNFQTQAIPFTANDRRASDNALQAPVGNLGATALANDRHSYTLRATEHGYIIGLACVQAEVTYQQGLHRMWTRSTRYDFYWPVFAHLGEQGIRKDELYVTGLSTDAQIFGYQERWAEYRHRPSRITGLFKSTTTLNIDEWHLAEQFGSQQSLTATFLEDKTYEVLQRILSAGPSADNMQVLFDSVFEGRVTRAMPMFSVPGNIDRF